MRTLQASTHALDERGEGVISAAIAVLIMAFLGAAMWFAFQAIFNDASERTSCNVAQIGTSSAGEC
jgi:hypothetical protein